MGKTDKITIPVRLDSKTFHSFAAFDTFVVKGRWKQPAIFAAILLACSLAVLLSGVDRGGVLSVILLVMALGLPLIFGGAFLSATRRMSQRSGLAGGRKVYTVVLSETGVAVENHQMKEPPQITAWPDAHKAWRRKDCIYLYVSASRAWLLPAGQADVPDEELWKRLQAWMGAEKCQG